MVEAGVRASEKGEAYSFEYVKSLLAPLSLSDQELSDLESTLESLSFRVDFYKSLKIFEQRREWGDEYRELIANGIRDILTTDHDSYRYLDNIIQAWNNGKGPQDKIFFEVITSRFRFLDVQLQNILYTILDSAYKRNHPSRIRSLITAWSVAVSRMLSVLGK